MRPTTMASVHDQRKRKRPPTSAAVSASPNAMKTTNTQYNPEPAPSLRSGSLGQNARAVTSAAVRPSAIRRTRSLVSAASCRRSSASLSVDQRAGARLASDFCDGLGWRGAEGFAPRLAICLLRTARRQFQNGHNPQQATGLSQHHARSRPVEPVQEQRAQTTRQGHQINRPDRLSRRQPARHQPVREVAAITHERTAALA